MDCGGLYVCIELLKLFCMPIHMYMYNKKVSLKKIISIAYKIELRFSKQQTKVITGHNTYVFLSLHRMEEAR